MAKRKTTARGLAKISGQGKPSAALPVGYARLLGNLKARVRAAQLRAAVSVNRELIRLYWDIGKIIVEAQKTKGYGKQVVERLAEDLQKEFPGTAGFSPQNVWFMRSFYLAWLAMPQKLSQAVRESKTAILSQPVRELAASAPPAPILELPWGHNRLLLTKLETPAIRLWYAHKAIEHGWSRAVLTHHIETHLQKREGKAVTNFQRTLPPPQSDLAEQTLKDPYNFDFLTIRSDAHERDLEQGLLDHIQKFLLELGVGFAFVGRQYHMEISGQDYYLDLLFYHLRLRCYVVIDLKIKAFEPEFAGKMNFYLSAVDDQLRHADDKPSIGLLLCKERDQLTVEYALRDLKKPIGVAQWQTKLVESLPRNLKGSLPTVAEIEAELDNPTS
ncbi:MAG TPA: PDDEXK nuclease domain-containing protein [Verrucomicrobiae bacterium]|jgi:predicted nuclease of restriction endonuclease-like (RecB) superfamily|nr:PDDEXK nuclease domain-containing protein [Verrucomicrobiae bacterium]